VLGLPGQLELAVGVALVSRCRCDTREQGQRREQTRGKLSPHLQVDLLALRAPRNLAGSLGIPEDGFQNLGALLFEPGAGEVGLAGVGFRSFREGSPAGGAEAFSLGLNRVLVASGTAFEEPVVQVFEVGVRSADAGLDRSRVRVEPLDMTRDLLLPRGTFEQRRLVLLRGLGPAAVALRQGLLEASPDRDALANFANVFDR
jgi:hypothetical protein